MSDTGVTEPSGGEQQQEGGEGAAPDPMEARFAEMRDSLTGSLQSGFQELRQTLTPEPEAPDPYADIWGPQDPAGQEFDLPDGFDQPGAQMTPEQAQQRLIRMAETAAEQKLGGRLAQLEQQLKEGDLQRRAGAIAQQYPKFREQEYAEQAIAKAEQQAHRMGRPDLAGDPDFILLTDLAGLAQANAQQQTAAGQPDDMTLEPGHGGQGPQALSGDEQADRILAAAQKRNPLDRF